MECPSERSLRRSAPPALPWKNVFRPWPSEAPGPWTGLWLESAGRRNLSRQDFRPAPGWYCIHVVERGSVRLHSGDLPPVRASQGELFALFPGVPHRFRADPPDIGDYVRLPWVRLRGPLVLDYMAACGLTPRWPVARAADPVGVALAMARLADLAEAYPPYAEARAVALLYEMAGACGHFSTRPPAFRPLADRVRDAMERDVASGRNIDDLARAFGVSRYTLFLQFREAFGKSPIEVLIETRIRAACHLLATTRRPIGEVALASGYGDPLYFARQFRQRMGMTPSDYRRANQRKAGRRRGK